MTGDPTNSSAPKETIEGSEGLAPIAKLILEKGFRNTGFHALYTGITNMANQVFDKEKCKQVSEEDVYKITDEVEEEEKRIASSDSYSEEVKDIMINYLKKLNHGVKKAYVQAQTPDALEEIKKA